MITPRQLVTAIAGATSIALMSGVGFLNIPFNPEFIKQSTATFLNSSTANKLAKIDVFFNSVALADTPIKAKPRISFVPPKRGTPSGRNGGATRGCIAQSLPVSLTLLAPNDHSGLTASGHPTFFWYVSNTKPVPLTFTLVEPKVAKPLFVKHLQVQKAGIMQLEMPKELPELIPGRQYRWSVAWVCDANRPSTNVVFQSWIKRVSIAPKQSSFLAAVTTEHDRALFYAKEGLWYDALDAIAKAYTAQPSEQSILEDFISLLNQVGITQVTAPNWQQFQSQSILDLQF